MTQAVDEKSKEMFADAVCQLLRESRRRQKLTQAQVAARTGGLISKAALANYETGHRSLRVDVLWVIARALGESMGSLIATAERGIVHRPDRAGTAPVTIDLAIVRASTDDRLAPVRRWVELKQDTNTAGASAGVMVLDQGALNALSSLMGVTPAECRVILRSVAGRPLDGAPGAPIPAQEVPFGA
ncbi:helix-turn-helix domain-containing protein [Nakamurella sp. YIM 132087]|uniref:Helix-turn-helix domain-containing protein n=1 Tax=Nakamurella alba TaxID=2665158 RepID=A0A7K1FPX1_9ACTN|nr:helix-turn-helix transcriptional regulator [Nakamurella alba]MTD16195.1 helix-turn-helix domain-containing protein [Nakamurella alba]